jgi:hypothetical protein
MTRASRHAPHTTDVPVQPVLLALSVVLLPVLLVAGYALYVRPDVGIAHFAWPVRPLMSSMMLGATYLGGATFFVTVLLSRRWRHVRLGFLPIAAFAGTLGITTLLHWSIYVHARWSFWVWAFLYFVVPVVLPVLWARNRRAGDGAAMEREGDLPPLVRGVLGGVGVVLTTAAVLLFVLPEVMIPTWPWALTTLTARIMSSMFILPGLVGLAIAADGSWASARHLLTVQAVTIALMLGAIVVARADLDWSSPASWIFTGGMSGILLFVGYVHAAMTKR